MFGYILNLFICWLVSNNSINSTIYIISFKICSSTTIQNFLICYLISSNPNLTCSSNPSENLFICCLISSHPNSTCSSNPIQNLLSYCLISSNPNPTYAIFFIYFCYNYLMVKLDFFISHIPLFVYIFVRAKNLYLYILWIFLDSIELCICDMVAQKWIMGPKELCICDMVSIGDIFSLW